MADAASQMSEQGNNMTRTQTPPLGAVLLGSGECSFCVWAPRTQTVDVCLIGDEKRYLPMQPIGDGYFALTTREAKLSDRYCYRLDGQGEFPDPASRSQPGTVHEPSQIVDMGFAWTDQVWFNLPLRDYVFYQLHVGTFTPEGTFDAVIPHLDRLKALGVTTLQLLPIAQFPGGRNWGYDGVQPYAVQNTYGGVQGLKRLVDACHARGLAVALDVVYNHLGAEGNYLGQYAPYFTEHYKSPWGASLNFDGEHSDEVRRYFIDNAIYWLDEFHIDALRLDATHALYDFSAVPFLEALTTTVHEWAEAHNRRVYLIAENDRSDVRLTRPPELGGAGLDAQWLDDLHHCVHTLLTGESRGYYADYTHFQQLVKAIRDGFVFSGDYSPYRSRRHGTSSRGVPGDRFIVAIQNHDQIGNRMLGERLSALIDFAGLKVAAGVYLWSPYLPLIFMGEEYGETAPFLYFISHGDPDLVEAVRQGRKEEFSAFGWHADPPDPQAEATFQQSKLNHDLRHHGQHRVLYAFYGELLRLRKAVPALRNPDKQALDVWGDNEARLLYVHRHGQGSEVLIIYNLYLERAAQRSPSLPPGNWRKQFDSEESRWQIDGQPGSPAPNTLASGAPLTLAPKAFALYMKEG